MVSPKELLSNISLLAPNTPSPTQRINLINSIRRARSSLQSLLTFPPPKASDRAQVQSREVRLPDSGPISLDEQDVKIALKLSDDLHLNEIDCVQLLVSANQEWNFLGREPLDILRLTAGLWYTGRRDLLTALYSLLRAVVLEPGLDDDLVADIQKYLEDLLNSGLRQRLISLIKELNREEAAGLGGPNCEPYIIDSRGALVERRAVVCRERLLLGHCLILSVLVVRASSKDLKDLFSVLKDTTTELDGSNDILKYQSNDDIVGTVDGVAAGVTVPPSNAISRPRGRPPKAPRKLSGKALGRPKKSNDDFVRTVDGVAAGVTVPPSNAISRPRGRPPKTPRKLSGKALGRPKKIEKIEIEEKKKLEEEDVELTKRTYELESKIIELESRLEKVLEENRKLYNEVQDLKLSTNQE